MRILVGVLSHETNSLTPVATARDDFDIAIGERMLDRLPIAPLAAEVGATLLPTVFASALPSGPVKAQVFAELSGIILDAAAREPSPDGVWIHLHGSMEVEGLGSGEASLLSRLRDVLGPDVPIAVALDFHANMTGTLAREATVIRGYRTAPHVDQVDTQIDTARLLLRCIGEGLRPETVLVPVPMISPGDALVTTVEPGISMMAAVDATEQREGVLSASIFGGQPWADVANARMSVVVAAEGRPEIAHKEAHRLARLCWSKRREIHFEAETAEPEDALRMAMAERDGPVFVSDSGDNTTGGAPGDDAGFLRMMIEAGVRDALLAGIADAEAIRACGRRTVGDEVALRLGGTLAPGSSEAVDIRGRLKHESAIEGWQGGDAGRAVVIETRGLDILVTEQRCAVVSPEIVRSAGVDPLDYKIIVVKLGYIWDALRPISKRAIIALTPGATCERLERIPYQRIRRPIYPLDTEFEWAP